MRRIGNWLLGVKDKPNEPSIEIGEEENQENLRRDPEKTVRREIESRLRAIELEYGLELKPIKVKKVGR